MVAILFTLWISLTNMANAVSQKQFYIMTSLDTTCPVCSCCNLPSSAHSYPVDVLSISGLPQGVPASAACAWQCTHDDACLAYNVWASIGQCELFTSTPLNLQLVAGCQYFQVCMPINKVILIYFWLDVCIVGQMASTLEYYDFIF